MNVPFVKDRDEFPRAPTWDTTSVGIVLLTALTLILFVFKPVAATGVLFALLAVGYGLRRPALVANFLLAFLWVNDVLSDFMPTGRFTAWKDVLLLFLVIGWLARTVLLRRPIAYASEVTGPYLALISIYLIMSLATPTPIQAILGIKATIWYATFFLLMPDIITKRRDARNLFVAIMVGTVLLGIYNLWRVQMPWGYFPPRRDGSIASGLMQAHWSGSAYLLPYGVLLGIGLMPSFSGWRRWVLNAALFIGGAGFIVTYLRANYAAMFLALVGMGILSRRLGQVAKLFLLAVVITGVVQSSMQVDVSDRITSSLDNNDVSREKRTEETMDLTLPWVMRHPLGGGTGAITAWASAQVWAGNSMDDMDAAVTGHIHNNLMLVAIEVGWLGLAVWIWLLIASIRATRRLYMESRDPFIRNYALGLYGICIFFFFMQPFQPMLVAPLSPVMYWPLLGLIPVLGRLDEQTPIEPEATALPEPLAPVTTHA